jgi:hypothetical protein
MLAVRLGDWLVRPRGTCACACVVWVPLQSAILPNLFVGDKRTAKDKDFLIENRITHILNITPTRTEDPVAGVPNYFEKDSRFTCVWVGGTASGHALPFAAGAGPTYVCACARCCCCCCCVHTTGASIAVSPRCISLLPTPALLVVQRQ